MGYTITKNANDYLELNSGNKSRFIPISQVEIRENDGNVEFLNVNSGSLVFTSPNDGIDSPGGPVSSEAIGSGDSSTVTFPFDVSASLSPGSVSVTDGTETFSDDGEGVLTGDAGGSGTVDYDTGSGSVTFNTAPATATDNVTIDYTPDARYKVSQIAVL